jgi:hypothetical protein
LKLMLDFVPNHTALDHAWVDEHPEYYIPGSDDDLAAQPQNYTALDTSAGRRVLAYGRDPYFDGWPDTLQLNYRHAGLRAAVREQIAAAASHGDGLRCDMAMLLLPEVFGRTWGQRAEPSDGSPPVDEPFWPTAIALVQERRPNFKFMAEVYWDLEWTLQQQGFDYTYDKRLYDRLHEQNALGIRQHLWADHEFQRKSVRFLENHDEPRAAAAFDWPVHQAAAVIAHLAPGMRFLHLGQEEGRRVRLSMHLRRRPAEPTKPEVREFYEQLLAVLKRWEVRSGQWQLIEGRPAWEGNRTHESFIGYLWRGDDGAALLAAVNYSPAQGQCYLPLPLGGLSGRRVVLKDLLGPAVYERDGDELAAGGLYLDLPAWGYHAFDVRITG